MALNLKIVLSFNGII